MPNISGPRYLELLRIEQRLRDYEEKESIKQFTASFVESVGMLLANTPYTEWPQMAKIALKHCAERAPMAAFIYQERLPK